MNPITFFVAGIPKGQPRPRAFARNMGGGKFVARVYDAGTAEGWKAQVALGWKTTQAGQFDGPLSVRLEFWMPRPKSHYHGKGVIVKDKAPLFHTGKPDCDNAAKAVLDALTQLSAWRDDAQVSQLTVSKRYAYHPGCQITIEQLQP